MTFRSLLSALLAMALLAACSSSLPPPKFVEERSVGTGTWVEVDALPAWVEGVPPRDGRLFFVATGMSNLRSIVTVDEGPRAADEARAVVLARLAPVVGPERAATVAARVDGHLSLVARACKEELLTRDPVPGNTLATAYALWELPAADLVATLPEDVRQPALTALTAAAR